MCLFKKKIHDDSSLKKLLIKRTDYLLDYTYKNGIDKRKELTDFRKKVLCYSFDASQCDKINAYLVKISGVELGDGYVDLFIEGVDRIMSSLFKRKNMDKHTLTAQDENDALIEQYELEIKTDLERLKVYKRHMEEALPERNKAKYDDNNAKYITLDNIIKMKQKALDTLRIKNNNLRVASDVNRVAGNVNKVVSNSNNYVDVEAVVNTLNENNELNQEIHKEREDLNNAIFGQQTFDDSFDKAYEEYLLNQSENLNAFNTNGIDETQGK